MAALDQHLRATRIIAVAMIVSLLACALVAERTRFAPLADFHLFLVLTLG